MQVFLFYVLMKSSLKKKQKTQQIGSSSKVSKGALQNSPCTFKKWRAICEGCAWEGSGYLPQDAMSGKS